MIADLRMLWQEAFGDSDSFIDLFFNTGYSPNRCHYIAENGFPVSALYWFDCELEGHRLAYIYGVATAKSHRGKGLARRLLEQTHCILQKQGYSGAVLVPSSPELFDFYGKFGYRAATGVTEFSCKASDTPAAMREVSAAEYARLRCGFAPRGSLALSREHFAFSGSYCRFYAGEDFLLICEVFPKGLRAQELLGNAGVAPGILRTLGLAEGRFRAPGESRDFAMWLPFVTACPKPTWFGPALD